MWTDTFHHEERVSSTDTRDSETQGSFVAILDVTLESDRAEKNVKHCEWGGGGGGAPP